MFDLTFKMLAWYTASGSEEFDIELARYKSYRVMPEELYDSVCTNDTLRDLVKTGLYKIIAANIQDLLEESVSEEDIVGLLLFPVETKRSMQRYARLAGIPGDDLATLAEYIAQISTMPDTPSNKYLLDVYKLLNLNVALPGSGNPLAKFLSQLDRIRNPKLVLATFCELVRYMLLTNKVFYIKRNAWMQFDFNSFLGSTSVNERYTLSTMLVQPKRSTLYGRYEVDIISSNIITSPNFIGRVVPSGLVCAHLICNVGKLIDILGHATAMSVSLFENVFSRYRTAEHTQLANVCVYKTDEVAMSTEGLEVLVNYLDGDAVISIHDTRLNTAVTTDADYWSGVRSELLDDHRSEALEVLRKYIDDDSLRKQCFEELCKIGG